MRRLNYAFDHQRERVGPSYKALMKAERRPAIPRAFSLLDKMPPAGDQGEEGDCAAFATGGALGFEQLRQLALGGGPLTYGPNYEEPSHQQLYWGGRELEGTTDQDAGIADLADMARVAQQTGVAREASWPYTPDDLLNPPPAEVLEEAEKHRISQWYQLDVGYQIKHCVLSGFPVMFGFQVPEPFMGDQMAQTGEMPIEQWFSGQSVGGHANLIIGFDDDRQCWLVRNSWGGGWGLQGNYWFPYEFMDSEFAGDFITLRSEVPHKP